jgi:predicted nucleic acid-binding protein
LSRVDPSARARRSGRSLDASAPQEFFVVATGKLGINPLDAKKLLTSFSNMEVVAIRPNHVLDAVDCTVIDRISFWDALIVVSARAAACGRIATEDLNDGQIIQGVTIWNPLENKNRPKLWETPKSRPLSRSSS